MLYAIFDNPFGILFLAGAVFIGLVVFRMFSAEGGRWLFVIPVLIAAAGVGIEYFVKTDKELIAEALKQAAAAVETQDIAKFAEVIAESYSDSFHSDKEQLISDARRRFSSPLIEKSVAQMTELEISEASDTAQTRVYVRVKLNKESEIGQWKPSLEAVVKVELVKSGQRWLIDGAELLEIDRQTMSWGKLRY